jgi:predicted nucleic acid-binding protein
VKLEVLRGVRNPKLKSALEGFMGVMMYVASDNRLWNEATELAWNLDRRGCTLPGADLVIAACALRLGAEILTLDGHFASIPELGRTPVPEGWAT